MRRSYRWGWQISDAGFKALMWDRLTLEELDKRNYVHQFLSPSVYEAHCGWYGLNYFVCELNDGELRREFVLMYADKNDTPNCARWIDVTGDSKGAIAEAVWDLVFA